MFLRAFVGGNWVCEGAFVGKKIGWRKVLEENWVERGFGLFHLLAVFVCRERRGFWEDCGNCLWDC